MRRTTVTDSGVYKQGGSSGLKTDLRELASAENCNRATARQFARCAQPLDNFELDNFQNCQNCRALAVAIQLVNKTSGRGRCLTLCWLREPRELPYAPLPAFLGAQAACGPPRRGLLSDPGARYKRLHRGRALFCPRCSGSLMLSPRYRRQHSRAISMCVHGGVW
jgi:hypothetical protein